MTLALNPDLLDTGTPPIPAAKAWLTAYDGRHGPAIDLSQAAPGAAPPAALLAKAGEAQAHADSARYGSLFGDMPLRAALAEDINRRYGSSVRAANVAITSGCNQAFVVAVMALTKAGDAVIVPTPWYFNHEMTLRMLGIEPRPLMTDPDSGFVPDVTACEALIDERVRAILLVTPNNPTGAVYPPALIAAFLDLARRKGVALILDETYRDFMPEGAATPHEAFDAPDWEERLIHLYSFSKAYAVPGWRLGALVAGEAAQSEIAKVLDCLQICPPRAAQTAITWAIGALGQWRHEERAAINARAAVFARSIASVPGWKLDQIGAYFAYVRHPFTGVDAVSVGEMLARRWGLLALPGPYFGPGQDSHLRFAFANVDETRIIEAVARLARVQPG